ncbi:hypothetical protein ACFL02_08395 [Planctomycetota bacterium]
MKKFFKSKLLILLILSSFIVANTGCGYILHPERRNAPLSREIDGVTVLFDCLWLIAGIVPGVIALVVDGVNDTWYYTEKELQEIEVGVAPGQELQLRITGDAPDDSEVALALVGDNGQMIQQTVRSIKAGDSLDVLSISVPNDIQQDHFQLVLDVNGQRQLAWDLHLN